MLGFFRGKPGFLFRQAVFLGEKAWLEAPPRLGGLYKPMSGQMWGRA